MAVSRGLPGAFLDDLKNIDGLLHPILERVQQDNSLMIAIRDKLYQYLLSGGQLTQD